MTLKEKIGKDFTDALKARDDRTLSVLRLLRTEIKKREVTGAKREMSDPEVLDTISSLVKQRRESIRLFQEGQRQDLVEKEEAELQILLSYLPQSLSSAEIEAIVDQIIAESQAAGPKDMGRVMKAAMGKMAGRADGKTVNEIVKRKLSQPGH